MILNKAFHSAIKEGMTVFNCSSTVSAELVFKDLVGKKGKVITGMTVDNETPVDVIYINAGYKTLSVLKRFEEALTLSRPNVFISVEILNSYTFTIKDILNYMISIGYMNLKLDKGQYAFTYEYHPSKVLL